MIGNDIIDIAEAFKINWKREGFLQKIFNKNEKNWISNSNNPGLIVWLLWSMKESAYKIFFRQYLERVYNPVKFECKLIKENSNLFHGEVDFNDITYSTSSKILEEVISTTAVIMNGPSASKIAQENIKCSCADYSTQHKELYNFTLKKISDKINKPFNALSIQKDLYGIPHLFYKNSLLNIPISLSHHGNYAAYAIVY